jgi:hypothetical protein
MCLTSAPDRIDTLLALALTFAAGGAPAPAEGAGGGELGEEVLSAALALLSSLDQDDRHAVEGRAQLYAGKSREQRARWLALALGRAGDAGGEWRLDEHVHPSHVAEALRDEPERIRLLVLSHLPRPFAEHAARILNVGPRPAAHADAVPPEVAGLIRRRFLSRFVRLSDLPGQTPLDALTGGELHNLMKYLGAREVAKVCRGRSEEALAVFLDPFPAEDAHMVATFIEPQGELGAPGRAEFALRLVKETLSLEVAPEELLNRIGLKLLALALAECDAARLSYTLQKLPFKAASLLDRMIASVGGGQAALSREVAAEAEKIAKGLRRHQSKKPSPRHA